jgi:hypothetical protein
MVQIVERVPNDNYCANGKRRMLADFIQTEIAGMTFARHPISQGYRLSQNFPEAKMLKYPSKVERRVYDDCDFILHITLTAAGE